MSLLNWKGYAASAAVGALLAGSLAAWGAWAIQENSYERQISDLKAEHAETLQGVATTAAKAADEALAQQTKDQKTIAALDERLTKEKANDKAEIDRLAAAVAAGNVRLRIKATCPKPASRDLLPGNATSASVDDESGPRLTDAAERSYWDLRRKIAETKRQIEGLQEFIRSTSD